LEATTFVRLLRANAMLRRELEARLLEGHSLTIKDYECLLVLDGADESSMRRVDLAGRLLLTASGITRLLDGLEQLGYVTKAQCKEDARVSYAVITPAGRRALVAATKIHHAALIDLLGSLFTRKELDTLNELLARLPGAADDVLCPLDQP
jgi:DNA-binding MarR family transcriptional regulator